MRSFSPTRSHVTPQPPHLTVTSLSAPAPPPTPGLFQVHGCVLPCGEKLFSIFFAEGMCAYCAAHRPITGQDPAIAPVVAAPMAEVWVLSSSAVALTHASVNQGPRSVLPGPSRTSRPCPVSFLVKPFDYFPQGCCNYVIVTGGLFAVGRWFSDAADLRCRSS